MTETPGHYDIGDRPSARVQKLLTKTLKALAFEEKVEAYEELFYLLKQDVEKSGTTGQWYAVSIIDDVYASHFH